MHPLSLVILVRVLIYIQPGHLRYSYPTNLISYTYRPYTCENFKISKFKPNIAQQKLTLSAWSNVFKLTAVFPCVRASCCPCTDQLQKHLSALNSIYHTNDDNRDRLHGAYAERLTHRRSETRGRGTRCSFVLPGCICCGWCETDGRRRPDGTGHRSYIPAAICSAARHTRYVTHADGS